MAGSRCGVWGVVKGDMLRVDIYMPKIHTHTHNPIPDRCFHGGTTIDAHGQPEARDLGEPMSRKKKFQSHNTHHLVCAVGVGGQPPRTTNL